MKQRSEKSGRTAGSRKGARGTPPHQGARIQSSGRPGGIRRAEWLLALAVSGIAVLLHASLWRHAGGLCRDEANSFNLATAESLGRIWDLGHFDSFPMLWPLVLRAWSAAGLASTDLALRALGLLLGLGVLGVLWWNARSFGYACPLITLVLLGLNAEIIRWSDAIRAYGVGTILLLVTYRLVWQLTRQPDFPRAVWAAAAATLSVQALYHNAVLVAAFVLGGVAVGLRARNWRAAVFVCTVGAAAAMSLLPYIPLLARTQEWSMLVRVEVSPGVLWAKAEELMRAPGGPAAWIWISLSGLTLVIGILLQSRRRMAGAAERERALALYSGAVLAAALPAYLLFLLLLGYSTESWYYIPLAAIVAACAETAIAAVATRDVLIGARAAIVLLIAAGGVLPAWRAVQMRQTNIDLLAARIAGEASKDDFVAVSPWFYGITFERYYRGAAPWSTVPPLESHRLHRYDLLKGKMVEREALRPVLSRMIDTLQQGHRVWVVGGLPPPRQAEAPPELPPPPLADTGWNVLPYMQSWLFQAGHHLWRHSREVQIIRMDEDVNPIENPPLMLAHPGQDRGR